MKKICLLLATFIFGCTSVFAQSGNSEPLKGDVNEDGTVDVADITAVIKIIKDNSGSTTEYKWFLGTLTEAQLTDQSYVNSLAYNQTGNKKPATLTVPSGYPTKEGNYLVFIWPESWGTPTIKSVNGFGTGDASASNAGINNPSSKSLKFWMGDGLTSNTVFNITWSE